MKHDQFQGDVIYSSGNPRGKQGLLFLVCWLGVGLGPLQAEQTSDQATARDPEVLLQTSARLNFEVNIPEFLYFVIGSPGATIDLMNFSPTAAQVGSGELIAGDPSPSTIVWIRSNGGQVTLTETNNSGGQGLSNATGSTISYSEILCTSSGHTSDFCLTLSDTGGNSIQLPMYPVHEATEQSAVWTFEYANTAVREKGIYGTSANGGRVTWTATTP